MNTKQWIEISATGIVVFIILNVMFYSLYYLSGFKEIIWIGSVISFAFGLVCSIAIYTLKEHGNRNR